jgi:hypothetical protein
MYRAERVCICMHARACARARTHTTLDPDEMVSGKEPNQTK